MAGFERIAEEKIMAAMRAGEFDDLAGKGKPIKLDEDLSTPENWRLAFHILRNNQMTLSWLETGKEIRSAWQTACHVFQQNWQRASDRQDQQEIEKQFTDQVDALNKKIMDYNLRVPANIFQMQPYNVRAVIQTEYAGSRLGK
jgi:hypothetical protein